MDLMEVVENMTEEMYLRMKSAAETGRWPDGTRVEKAQQLSAVQITMAYQAHHHNSSDTLSIGGNGEMIIKTKAELRKEFPAEKSPSDIARFTEL